MNNFNLRSLLAVFADDEKRAQLFFGKDPEQYILPEEFYADLDQMVSLDPSLPPPLRNDLRRMLDLFEKATSPLVESQLIDVYANGCSHYLDVEGNQVVDKEKWLQSLLKEMYAGAEWKQSIAIAKRTLKLL